MKTSAFAAAVAALVFSACADTNSVPVEAEMEETDDGLEFDAGADLRIRQEIMDGADFDELAQKYNEDDKTAYSFMKGDMPEAFEDAAFELDTDEVSQVVETPYGYHLIKCVSTFDRDETDQNKEKIVRERKNEAFNEIYGEFVRTVHSNLNEELWNSIEF